MIGIVAEGGNVNDYGFHIEGSFCEALKTFLKNNVKELDNDHIVFWQDVIARMSENYNELSDKETVDSPDVFEDLDFVFAKRKKDVPLALLP